VARGGEGVLLVKRLLLAGALAALLLTPSATAALTLPPLPPLPIPNLTGPSVPPYEGAPAAPQPIHGTGRVPHNRFMAANGVSEIHDDGWQTDAYTWAGPLGRSPQTRSTDVSRDCGTITFDGRGRLVSICIGVSGPQLYMFDPNSLATLATFNLPPRQSVPSNAFQDYTGGGYFYLDNHDRIVTATTTRHIYVIAETSGPGFQLVRDYDLSHVLTSSESITSALPDSHGLLWIVAKTDGVVATLNLRTGAIHSVRLGDEIENSFATDARGGVYIATNRRLYRFGTARGGAPKVAWQIVYPNSREHKPGQVDDGTGTTPTVMPGGYVNITDNADPMDVVVYRTAARLAHGHRRMVCRVPVFARGASDTENSLIAAGRSMIVENNYGYNDPTSVSGGRQTAPGLARVDINPGARGCRKVWENDSVAAPTVVPKLSLANGVVYTYTKGGVGDPWYWTGLDFRTGRLVFLRLAGLGSVAYNNNYAGIALSPHGTAYLGLLDGLIALRP
jgi:hypothetical protein